MQALHSLHILLCAAWLAIAVLLTAVQPTYAQAEQSSDGQVQVIEGSLDSNQAIKYRLPNLNAGDTLYIYAGSISGNFDPLLGVAAADVTLASMDGEIRAAIEGTGAIGADPMAAISSVMDALFLTSDDDSGTGYDAAISFTIPTDGDYALVLRSSYARSTFGIYRLMIGINAPEVQSGEAEPTGNMLAVFDESFPLMSIAVQEINDTLSPEIGYQVYQLADFGAGSTLYVNLTVTEGEIPLRVMVQDFVGKSIVSAEAAAASETLTLEYTFTEPAAGYQLIVIPGSPSASPAASY